MTKRWHRQMAFFMATLMMLFNLNLSVFAEELGNTDALPVQEVVEVVPSENETITEVVLPEVLPEEVVQPEEVIAPEEVVPEIVPPIEVVITPEEVVITPEEVKIPKKDLELIQPMALAPELLAARPSLNMNFQGFGIGQSNNGWTEGNLGKTYAEGEWAPYMLVIDGASSYGGIGNLPDIQISYDFTDQDENRVIDLAKSIQVGSTELNNTQGWPALGGGSFSMSNRDEIEIAQKDNGENAWTGFNLLNLPQSQVNVDLNGNLGTPNDMQRMVIIKGSDILAANPDLANSDRIVIYLQLHLARTVIWSDARQSIYDSGNYANWGGWVYGESSFDTDTRNGAAYTPGSSGQIRIAMSGIGDKTVPRPVAEEQLMKISGYKWLDSNRDRSLNQTEQKLPEWYIVLIGITDGLLYVDWTQTDESGNYTFDDLPSGRYWILEASQLGSNIRSMPVNGYVQTYPASGYDPQALTSVEVTDQVNTRSLSDIADDDASVQSAGRAWRVDLRYDSPVVNPGADFGNGISGELRISKTWDDNDTVGNVSSRYPNQILVDVVGPSPITDIFTTVALNAGNDWSVDLLNLPPGDYTVTEREIDASDDNYGEWTIDMTPRNITVLPGSTVDDTFVTFNNLYIPGALRIVKSFTGYEYVPGFNETAMLPASIDVEVTGPSYPNGETFTLHKVSNYALEIPNLISGGYMVTEVNPGSQWSVSVSPSSIDVDNDETTISLITITNTYVPGALRIIKSFTGYDDVPGFDENTMIPDSINVTLSGPSYPNGTSIDLTAPNYSIDVPNLLPGNYSVIENTLGTDWTSSVNPASASVIVEAGDEADANIITITNTYVPGALRITKSFTGYENVLGFNENTMIPDSINVTLSGPSYPNGTSIDLTAPNYWVDVTNILPGNYSVVENTLGADWTSSVSPTSVEVVAGETADANILAITNTYVPGALRITKEFEGYEDIPGFDENTMIPDSINIEITGPSYPVGGSYTIYKSDEFKLDLTNLLPGEYFVYEYLDGAEWSSVVNPISIEVTAGETAGDNEITITNTYVPGALRVNKLFVDRNGAAVTVDRPTSVTINVTGPSYPAPTGMNFILTGPNYTTDITNIIPGTYQVKEVSINPDTGKWTLDPTTYSIEVAIDSEASDNVVTITNVQNVGSLEITKIWNTGDPNYVLPLPEYIQVKVMGPSYPIGEIFNITPNNGTWYLKIENLIPGQYTVSERGYDPNYVDGNKWTATYTVGVTVSSTSGSVAVPAGGTGSVLITNSVQWKSDTIWAYRSGSVTNMSVLNKSSNWGWNFRATQETTYQFDLYAGAAQNNIAKGTKVGTLTLVVARDVAHPGKYTGTVTYNVVAPYTLTETHVWMGSTNLPTTLQGKKAVMTDAPGQMTTGLYADNLTLPFYMAAHGVVRYPVVN